MNENLITLRPVAVPSWLDMGMPVHRPHLVRPKRSRKPEYLPLYIQKMIKEKMDSSVIESFRYYYEKVRGGADGMIGDDEINRIAPGDIVHADQLAGFSEAGRKSLPRTAMIVLNGGLGTSMGLDRAKSLIRVKGSASFLEITLNQALRQDVKLCFMNSFNTDKATRDFIASRKVSPSVLYFVQNKYPKILKDSLAPAKWRQDPELEWNPPGHGDIFTAIYASGTLGRLLDGGIRYAFVSNSDNLGGTIDEGLLGYFVESRIPFMLEVSRRNPSDIKGGHIARSNNGRLVLREISQCPQQDLPHFQNIHYHCFFNTNNIWINLEELYRKIKSEGVVRLPMILNPKTLDPKDENSPPVYQIETAMGSAVSLFRRAQAVAVDRTRFFPVKTCNDLLLMRSDRVLLTPESKLIPNPENRQDIIDIRLDPEFYGKIDLFEARFPYGPPSLTHCSSLAVEGDVLFEGDIVIKGITTIRNLRNKQQCIKAGTIVSGDLVFE